MAIPQDAPAKRIFFHIGAPKTGTTWLQGVLFDNRQALAADGVLYPYTDFGQSFRSMQDFRGATWGGRGPSAWTGEWDEVAARCRAWTGHTAIVSNEIFGLASLQRIAAGLASVVDEEHPAEIHVVFTARDLARQLVSDWQEQVKHKHTVTLDRFVSDLVELGLDAPEPFGEMFWGLHDAPYVLQRWAQVVPASNIHVVTVPPPGGVRDGLWNRFCSVVGLDPTTYDTATRRSNTSMGVAETEFLRRLNADVHDVPGQHYDPLARIFLAEEVLGNQSAKLTLPSRFMPWAVERSHRLVEQLSGTGYHVVGDLDDLLPRPDDHLPCLEPSDVTDEQLLAASTRAAVALFRRSARLRDRVAAVEAELNGRPAPPAEVPLKRRAYLSARRRAGRVRRAVRARTRWAERRSTS